MGLGENPQILALAQCAGSIGRRNLIRSQGAIVKADFVDQSAEHDIAIVVAADAQIGSGSRNGHRPDHVGADRLAIIIKNHGVVIVSPGHMGPGAGGQRTGDGGGNDILGPGATR